ncbi:hypothetical protein U9M48_001446 [Paspalum notatum var. saurae]|uniref:Uncharacterized protein n=1 Tax=Paspalum notatum var. saurae TaxID=547442 RepID=A0AAQ3PI75_PASNO
MMSSPTRCLVSSAILLNLSPSVSLVFHHRQAIPFLTVGFCGSRSCMASWLGFDFYSWLRAMIWTPSPTYREMTRAYWKEHEMMLKTAEGFSRTLESTFGVEVPAVPPYFYHKF